MEFSPRDGVTLEFRSATLTQSPQVSQTVTVALSLFSIVPLWGQPIVALPIAAAAALIATLPTLRRRLRHPAP